MSYIRDLFAGASHFAAAAIGRPRAIEGEQMLVADGLMASLTDSKKGGVYFLPIDEIVQRQGYKTYEEMREDDQVKATLAFKRILISGRTWDLKPAFKVTPPPKPDPVAVPANDAPPPVKAAFPSSNDAPPTAKKPPTVDGKPMKPGKMPDGTDYVPPTPEEQAKADKAEEVARFVDWALRRIDLDAVFNDALTALEYGYALGEKVFERTKFEGKQVVTLKKLAFRDPKKIELARDEHGNWTGARQRVNGRDIELGPEKLFLYTYNGRFGNIYGSSDLRAAYRSWWAKKFIINFWNVYLERMGSPMTMMKYPQGASKEMKETIKRILKNLASKTEILVPQGVEVELIEAKRAGAPDYASALSFHNNSIARALLMVSLLGTGGDDNSHAASDSQSALHLRILFKMADAVAQNLQRQFMQQVVRQLVEFNFDGDVEELMPTFIWQDYGQFEGMKVADTIRLLHAAGILDMDQEDVNYARSILGLPIRGENDTPDKIQRPQAPPPPADPNKPPPSAGQGNERAKKGGDTTTKTKNSDEPRYHIVLREADEDTNSE